MVFTPKFFNTTFTGAAVHELTVPEGSEIYVIPASVLGIFKTLTVKGTKSLAQVAIPVWFSLIFGRCVELPVIAESIQLKLLLPILNATDVNEVGVYFTLVNATEVVFLKHVSIIILLTPSQ